MYVSYINDNSKKAYSILIDNLTFLEDFFYMQIFITLTICMFQLKRPLPLSTKKSQVDFLVSTSLLPVKCRAYIL